MTITFPSDTAEYLAELSEATGKSYADVIRRAISTEYYIWDQTARKQATILVKRPNEETKEVVFR